MPAHEFHENLGALHVLLISNPDAGDGGPDVDDLVARVRAQGHSVVAQSVKDDGWETALDQGVDLAVAAGGDGTVAEVFKKVAGSDVVATLLPHGSANNIAKSLGLEDVCPDELINGWSDSAPRRFDVGTLVCGDRRVRFVESAGGGLFSEMLVHAQEIEDTPNGADKLELGLKLLRKLVDDVPARDWLIEADGSDLSGAFLAVEALNISQIGPNVELAASADTTDGMLELALLSDDDRPMLGDYVNERLQGGSTVKLQATVHRVRELTFRRPPGCPVHFDDEVLEGCDETARCVARVGDTVGLLLPRATTRAV